MDRLAEEHPAVVWIVYCRQTVIKWEFIVWEFIAWEFIASRTLIPGVSGSPVLNSHQPAFQRLHRCDNWDSPYGDLIVDLPVEGSAGTLHVKPRNTLALFYHAARFSLMLFDIMSGLILRRGTKAGSFEAIRITLCAFPHWVRTRKGLRWITLCYPKT